MRDADELEVELDLVPAGEGSEDSVVVCGPALDDEVGLAAAGGAAEEECARWGLGVVGLEDGYGGVVGLF